MIHALRCSNVFRNYNDYHICTLFHQSKLWYPYVSNREDIIKDLYTYDGDISNNKSNVTKDYLNSMGMVNALLCNRNGQAQSYPYSKVHGANMGPIWGRQDPGWPHVGPMNFVIWAGDTLTFANLLTKSLSLLPVIIRSENNQPFWYSKTH